MNECFNKEYTGTPFKLFGTVHLTTLGVLILFNLVLILELKHLKNKKINMYFRYGFSAFIVLADMFFFIWSFSSGYWSIKYALPLHICDVSVILSVIMLTSKNYFTYEITYFWGLAGSVQAMITPDIAPYNFPHYIFFNFFILHGSVVTSVLYMTVIEHYRPRFVSVWKTLAFTNAYAGVVAVVNVIVDSNYLFLCHKPYSPSIIDYMGPWPWYLLSLEVVAVASFLLCYLPFAAKDVLGSSHDKGKGYTM